MNLKVACFGVLPLVVSALGAGAAVLPPPIVIPVNLRTNEQAVTIEQSSRTVNSNGLYRLVENTFVFSNPNARALAADFEFPIPEGATVCGYRLEIDGVMVPGVVCEKEAARVAFENEQRKGVDPGLVEHVKGNIWRTRIFPLPAKGTRKAEVSYIVPDEANEECVVTERWEGFVYEGRRAKTATQTPAPAERCKTFGRGMILWDASLSRKGKTAADLAALKTLPASGEWQLVVFRDVPEAPRRFTSRDELVAAVAAEPCDGGTDLSRLLMSLGEEAGDKLLFSDEVDTLGAGRLLLDARSDLIFASRPAPQARTISVARRAVEKGKDEAIAVGKLLATAWAANRIADLSAQADSRKEEFLELGRAFGVASPVTSLLVLETLDQWLEHKIEPPKELSFHDAWVRRRAAEDDPIAAKKEQAAFEKRLLELWEERIKWWKDPKPPKVTPRSGLFDGAVTNQVADESIAGEGGVALTGSPRRPAPRAKSLRAVETDAVMLCEAAPACAAPEMAKNKALDEEPSATASVALAAWDPKTPYLDALKRVKAEDAYAEYLRQSEKFGNSPAFYLDCAGWFFRQKQEKLAKRIISNLAEFKLEDPALWRTMGWRLREAEAFDEAVRAFRHALELRPEEGQSWRDLALVLCEQGKELQSKGERAAARGALQEALEAFHAAAFGNHARRSAWRSNDLQVSIIALEELNGLIAWCAAQAWKGVEAPSAPKMDAVYRRDLPMDLRIILSWDADETDIDIHVLEPDGEEAFYQHRRTSAGGFVGEDVTTGYGPEEYLRKDADKGIYKVLSNYFASHQQSLTGAVTVTATIYTNWSRRDERRQTLTLRLDQPKDKHLIGEVTID